MDPATESELSSFADVTVERDDADPTASTMAERLRGIDVVLSLNGHGARDVTPEALRDAGTVRLVCVAHPWGHFDDIEERTGIPVVEVSNAGTVAVAEWTVGAVLMGVRRLHAFDRALKAGSAWGEPRRSVGMLADTTVGIVGYGRTARYTARLLRCLGAAVVVATDSAAAEARAAGLEVVSLDELLSTADVVSLHQRVTDSTRGMLGRRKLARLKDECVLINGARAELYDEEGLVEELQSGRLSAYLDVYATEPLPLDHPFRTLDNVLITPHIAGNNAAMFRRCGRDAVTALREFAAGRLPRDRRYAFP
jgi:phosphoglycerate dehydrogenase-like enzyme